MTSSDGQSTSQDQLKSRQATLDDLEDIVERARRFHSQSIWKDVLYDEDRIRGMISALLLTGGVFINSCGGFIAGTIVPILFSATTLVATELAWFAPNGGGRELRESFEEWGRMNGANLLQFCALASDNFDEVHRNMDRNGFALAELNYVKVL